jgi:hypothetical protein
MTTETTKTPSKQALCNALRAFIGQRSGIDFRNYQSGNWQESRRAFMGDYRPILKAGRQARELLRYVELRDSITAENLIAATRAYSGRLQFQVREGGRVGVEYVTGQYFATEYRKAACAVLASAIWDYLRGNMPKGELRHNSETGETLERYEGLRAGDWLRRAARREFGRGIASAWFN